VNGGDDPDRPYEKVGNIALVGMWLLVKIKGKGKELYMWRDLKASQGEHMEKAMTATDLPSTARCTLARGSWLGSKVTGMVVFWLALAGCCHGAGCLK
jgi:hypothetical protein